MLFAVVALLTVAACAPQVPLPPPAPEHVLTAPLRGRNVAALLVTDAASRVEVESVELPGQLYRITTPADGGLVPRVTVTRGLVRVELRFVGRTGPDTVRILLNRSVRWDVRLPAGAGEQRLDLSTGWISRVELGAAGLVEMQLPRPRGRVPLVFRESVGALLMRVAGAPPPGAGPGGD
ncbi:hypothetical protein AB0M20_44215, partial [Actinoplanes sp. NPDC051633]